MASSKAHSRRTGDPLTKSFVKEVRIRHNLSQDEFAERLGIRGGKSVISGWENGHAKCEGPAAELILLLFGGERSAATARVLAQADAAWVRAGNYVTAWRQIAIVPSLDAPIERGVFATLFPGIELPPNQHAHGFPAINHELPDDVYGIGPHGWTGIIPVERDRPPQFFWRLGREAEFIYRERIWEDDPMSVTNGHTHFGALLEIAMSATFFYQRLAARCELPPAARCRLQLDFEGVAGRGVVAYRSGRANDDFGLDEPHGVAAENHISVAITRHIQEILTDPLRVGYALVGEAALVLRPDLSADSALEEQLRRRHRQDDSGSRIRFLGFLDSLFSRHKRRRAIVKMDGTTVGVLQETDQGSSFSYDEGYLKSADALPLSPTLPLEGIPFESRELLPFFANMLPEGARLDFVSQRLRIDRNDRFGVLLATGRDAIGAVEIHPDQAPSNG